MRKLLQKLAKQKTSIPVLDTIQVKNGIATATNLETWLVMPVELKDGLYNGHTFEDIAQSSDIDIEQFPLVYQLKKPKQNITIPMDDLAYVAKAMSKEQVRYYLNGICFDKGQYVATDGHRLHAVTCDALDLDKVIVPREAIEYAIASKVKTVRFMFCENGVQIDCDDMSIITRYIDGTFPDYERVIPECSDNPKEYNLKPLKKQAAKWKRIAKNAGHKIPHVEWSNKIKLDQVEGVEIETETPLPEITGYNLAYLMDCPLSGVMHWKGSGDPVKFIDKDKLAVLMPIRL